MDEQFWDQMYGEQDRLWSGDPNGALVAEAGDLTPGHALDVGCGEGGDAHWLATQGWTVTGVDLSRVALERARQVCRGQPVELRQQDLTRDPPKPPLMTWCPCTTSRCCAGRTKPRCVVWWRPSPPAAHCSSSDTT